MLIITVPHDKCSEHKKSRNCDLVAQKVADRIYERLKNHIQTRIYHADRYRSEGDLNRIETFDTTWRQNITNQLKSGDILLDIHSFPNTVNSFGTINEQIPKIVLLDMDDHTDLCDQVKSTIPSTKYMRGSSKNDIVKNALDNEVDAMLWEFNESTITDEDINKFADIMSKYIKTYTSNNSGLYNFLRQLWFYVGLIIMVIFLIWISSPEHKKSLLYINYNDITPPLSKTGNIRSY